jgi:hypothetical protein
MMKKSMIIGLLVCFSSLAGSQTTQWQENDPFKPILGRWKTSDARFSSLINDRDNADFNTRWDGKMYGIVKISGELLFKAENGCVLSGVVSPFASSGMWVVNGQLEGCKVEHFNQKVFGNVRRDGSYLIIEVGEMPFMTNRLPVRYTVKTRLQLY